MRVTKIASLIVALVVLVVELRAVGSRAIVFVASLLQGESFEEVVRRRAELSNGGVLEVRGRSYNGPHGLPFAWDATYRAAGGASVEAAGSWAGGRPSGDLVACPIDKLVVVVPFEGLSVFVRAAGGHWRTFDLRLPGQAPAAELPRYAGARGLTIDELHRLDLLYEAPGRSLGPGPVAPYLVQLEAGRHELVVDYDLSLIRRVRLRLEVAADGERRKLLGPTEPPERTHPLVLDVPWAAGCTTLEMLPTGRGLETDRAGR